MRRRRPSQKVLRHLCAQVDDQDGIGPRDTPRGLSRRRPDRKLRQLCSQVAETLSYVLPGPDGDEWLSRLQVFSVAPAPHAGRLLVTVGPLPSESLNPGLTLDALERASGRLRTEIAATITRRRAPLLTFRIALPGGDNTAST